MMSGPQFYKGLIGVKTQFYGYVYDQIQVWVMARMWLRHLFVRVKVRSRGFGMHYINEYPYKDKSIRHKRQECLSADSLISMYSGVRPSKGARAQSRFHCCGGLSSSLSSSADPLSFIARTNFFNFLSGWRERWRKREGGGGGKNYSE